MIADPIFKSFVPEEVADNLRTAGEEFNQAERADSVTELLGKKYFKALGDYRIALAECPYAPGNLIIDPDEHSTMMRQKMDEELARTHKEVSRILGHFGGVLSLWDT